MLTVKNLWGLKMGLGPFQCMERKCWVSYTLLCLFYIKPGPYKSLEILPCFIIREDLNIKTVRWKGRIYMDLYCHIYHILELCLLMFLLRRWVVVHISYLRTLSFDVPPWEVNCGPHILSYNWIFWCSSSGGELWYTYHIL